MAFRFGRAPLLRGVLVGGAATDDPTMAKLTQLGQMRQQGLLTDAEFTAAKAKLLGI